MNIIQKRFLAFLLGCIVLRLLFVLVTKYSNPDWLPYFGALALLPAFGFMFIYLFQYRKKGGETFGQKIWWDHLRPIHACFYLLFALWAFRKKHYAWVALFIDVFIGLFSFLFYHYNANNFDKLFSKIF
jgi:hypothetical protein